MKKAVVVMAVLFVFSGASWAQMGKGMTGGGHEMKGEHRGHMGEGMTKCGMMGEGHQMPMMRHMMGHGMMMQEMMHMMKDMIKMQERMMSGATESEKKDMSKELSGMRDRMDRMMSNMQDMMMKGMMQEPPKGEAQKEEPKEEKKPEPHKH